MADAKTPEPELIEVEATVNFEGLFFGEHVEVDPTDPFIAARLRAELLVPVKEEEL